MHRILITFFLGLFCVVSPVVAQTYVSPDGTGSGASWGDASNLADAVANASSGDELWLREGVYNISATLEIMQSNVSLYGGFSGTETALGQRDPEANETILDGGGDTQIMVIDRDGALIEGLTFRNGYMDGPVSGPGATNSGGGAIRVAGWNSILRDVKFLNNVSSSERGGGAIFIWRGIGLLIEDCVFEGNQVVDGGYGGGNGGGAIHNWDDDVVIRNSVFRDNSSIFSGGAIYTWSVISIQGCTFENNESNESGGAIYNNDELILERTTFTGNKAGTRGGALHNNSAARLTVAEWNQFTANTAEQGGAIYNSSDEGLKVISSLFIANQAADMGGAIFNNHFIEIVNSTFVGNTNTALIIPIWGGNDNQTNVFNSIFYQNAAKAGGYRADIHSSSLAWDQSTKDIRRNILQEYDAGTANLVGVDPVFVNQASDFRLQTSSPAIDAGRVELFNQISDVNADGTTDIGGNLRNQGANIDMGAYETDPETIVPPECTVITAPLDGSTDVALDAVITWTVADEAAGYRVYIGTSAGGTDVVNGEEVTGTTYTPATEWEEGETYFVRVVPYNAAGTATDCPEISFTTETLLAAPECTEITAPSDGSTDVALDAVITWTAADEAAGYRVYIGTSSGATDVVNGEEVTGTTYTLAMEWEEGETYFVRVVPYNAAGTATDCPEISFTTETLLAAPECTVITAPVDGGIDVALDAVITWTAADEAAGYRVYIGTSAGGTDVVNGEEVTGTTYTPATEWEEGETYFVRVIPYNAAGTATDCPEISFTTETLLAAPECTAITAPADGSTEVVLDAVITWAAVDSAAGYRVYIGTSAGGTDVVNGEEVTGTTYTPVTEWEEGETYFARVVPYNAAGAAEGCPEISFTAEVLEEEPPVEPPLPTAPECTVITAPAAGSTDVALDAVITWTVADGADGYWMYIGTSSGATDVVNGEEVTGTTYTPVTEWEEGETYFVRVVPYNAAGAAEDCPEISFTTEVLEEEPPVEPPLPTAPECTAITAPADGSTEVALDAVITWTAVDEAAGYRVYIGTSSGATDVVNGEEVTGTTYTPATEWEEGETYFVRVVPYNAAGAAEGCPEISFTTEVLEEEPPVEPPLPTAPECTAITAPADGSTDVALDAVITWAAVDSTAGYRVYIGTSSGATDVVDGTEVTGTTYTHDMEWEEATEYFVRVVPYNAAGAAEGCPEVSFTTEVLEEEPPVEPPLPTAPECTVITAPADGSTEVVLDAVITWTAADEAAGYRVYIGTSSGATDVVAGEEVIGTTYTHAEEWEEGETYFVRVVPYNAAGAAEGCPEISFTTEVLEEEPPVDPPVEPPLPEPPGCTVITSPADGQQAVTLDAGITWLAVEGADGYRLTIGTAPDRGDLVAGEEVTGTVYHPSFQFIPNTTYYITVTPFNDAGDAVGCGYVYFTIIPDDAISRTKYGFSPNRDGINDYWSIDGIEQYPENTVTIHSRWGDLVFQADGYDNTSTVFRGEANRLTRLGAGTLPAGTYFFTIHYHNGQEMKRVEGFVVLRR